MVEIVLPSLKTPDQLCVLATGGRHYKDNDFLMFELLDDVLNEAHRRSLQLVIVNGGATGADAVARRWARQVIEAGYAVTLVTVEAEWARLGRAAGPIRNQRMLDENEVDLCLAAPGGIGTNDMTRRCIATGIPVIDVVAAPG